MVRWHDQPMARHDLIITPAYTHVHHELQLSVARSGMPWHVLYNHSDLVRVRSALISQALDLGAEVVLFVDADNVPGDGVLARIADSVTPERATFGVYSLRDGRRSVQPVDESAVRPEPYRITYGGLGLAAVHRESLTRVAHRLQRVTSDTVPWDPFCLPFVDDAGVYHGDDRSLCARLIDSGTQLWADPRLVVHHAITTMVGLPR